MSTQLGKVLGRGQVAKYALDGLPNQVMTTECRTTLSDEPTLVAEVEKTQLELMYVMRKRR